MRDDLMKLFSELKTTGAEGELRTLMLTHQKNSIEVLKSGDLTRIMEISAVQMMELMELTAKFARQVDLARSFLLVCNAAASTGILFSDDAPIEYFESVAKRIRDHIERLRRVIGKQNSS